MATHRRKIFLVNPRFQIKFSLLICLLVFISSIFYPLSIYDLIDKFVALAQKSSPESISNAAEYKTALIWALVLFQVGFMAIAFLATIFLTHRVAGPLYKLQKFLREKREGHSYGKLFFRNGDYFPEIAEEFNKTFEKLESDYANDMSYLSEVCSYLKNIALVVPDDKKVVLEEIINKLTAIQGKFQDK